MISENNKRVFDWGILLEWNDERWLKNKNQKNFIMDTSSIFIDRFNGNCFSVYDTKEKTLDETLEEYRESKGYEHSIKYPQNEDFINLSINEKVFLLLKSKEIYQIKQGIKLIEKYNLPNIEGVIKGLTGRSSTNIIRDIYTFFDEKIFWYESKLTEFPKEILLIKDFIKSLTLWLSDIEIIPDLVSEFNHIETISIIDTKIKTLPLNLCKLKKLREINFSNTGIPLETLQKIQLPRNCKLTIQE
jgi:hypothetical protein